MVLLHARNLWPAERVTLHCVEYMVNMCAMETESVIRLKFTNYVSSQICVLLIVVRIYLADGDNCHQKKKKCCRPINKYNTDFIEFFFTISYYE